MNEYENNHVIEDLQSNGNYLAKVFLWMFMGLFATGLVSYVTYSTGLIYNWAMNGAFGIILLVELVVVVVFSLLFHKLSPMGASILFFIYAIINGVTLSTIYVVYQLSSIMYVFFATALFFGILSLIGYRTKVDLSKIGTIALVALCICIVVSIVNLFMKATIVDFIIDWVIIILFAGITAYDMQKIKQYAGRDEKAYIYGAMDLYLDFINIFLRLLSLFGKRRD